MQGSWFRGIPCMYKYLFTYLAHLSVFDLFLNTATTTITTTTTDTNTRIRDIMTATGVVIVLLYHVPLRPPRVGITVITGVLSMVEVFSMDPSE